MDRHGMPAEDLSERRSESSAYNIPRGLAIGVFAILTVSGILIGALLPDLIDGTTEEKIKNDLVGEYLDVVIASTISDVEIAGTSYSDIPVPTAFQVLFADGDPSEDYPSMDEVLTAILDYLLGEGSHHTLKVIPGTGLDGSDYVVGNEGDGPAGGSSVKEVPVGLGDDEGSVVFELKVWGVNPA
ncbi:MAG: hypothetical protein ACMUHU_04925 [Thermoplasmatota archaeon]